MRTKKTRPLKNASKIFSIFFEFAIDIAAQLCYNIYRSKGKEVMGMTRKERRRAEEELKLSRTALILAIVKELVGLIKELIK